MVIKDSSQSLVCPEKPDEAEENENSGISKSIIKPRTNLSLDIPPLSVKTLPQFPEMDVNIVRLV